MTAGGVGVRIKAYKQAPAVLNGDLFGNPEAEEPAAVAAGEAVPGEISEAPAAPVSNESAAEAAAALERDAALEQDVALERDAEAEQAAMEERVRVFEERARASRERAGILGEPAIEQVAASAAPAAEPKEPEPVQDVETVIAKAVPTPTKRATAAKRPATAKQGPSKRGRKSLKQVAAEADLIEIPEDQVLFSKQYYTMGEVSEMFHVNQSLLRFWETEFDILQPRKNKKGDRYFRPVDIKNLHLIYHLLRQKKYTIEGAKEFLKNNKKAEERFEVIQRLQQIKAFLQEMKAQL